MKTILILTMLCACQPIDGYQDYYIWEQIGEPVKPDDDIIYKGGDNE